jgi:signal transduction histidine kinase
MKLFSPSSWGLSVKFALTITAVVAGVAFTIGAAIVVLDWNRFRDELDETALLLARSVSVTAPEAILSNDYWFLYGSLKKMAVWGPGGMPDTRILTGMILSPEGLVLAHLQPRDHALGLPLTTSDPEEAALLSAARSARAPTVLRGGGIGAASFLEGVVPLYSDEKLLGVVRIRLSTNELYLKTWRSAYVVLGITLGLVVLGSLLGATLSRRMVEPLTAMTRGMEVVGRGELENIPAIPPRDDDEIGRLARTFNKMANELAEKKQLEEQMAVSEKLVSLGRIAAGVAHEVNNPLAGLLNCIDTLKKHPDNTELMERYLPLIEKGLNRIKDIVESLLVELRIEDANELSDPSCLEDLKEVVEAEIDDRDVRLVWENRLDDGVRIKRRQIQQVVFNLLKNSVQAVPEGGTVTFRSFQEGDQMVLEVGDDGPGIPVENRSQLFDPFFTTKPYGTGLGLWIVYRLVERMRGIIEVQSEIGRGTRFQVTLPLSESGS